MPFVFVDDVHGDDTKQERTSKAYHKGSSHHTAAMPLIFATLARSHLHIAWLAVYMRFGSEDACDSLGQRLWLRWCGCVRGVTGMFVIVCAELDVVILGDCSVLFASSVNDDYQMVADVLLLILSLGQGDGLRGGR